MTLIELMIVVTIIGILAAIAIPSFIGYHRRAQSSEAVSNLGVLYRAAASYYVMEFPRDRSSGPTFSSCVVDSAGPIPATPSTAAHVVDFSTDPSFAALELSMAAPIRYGYEIVSVGGCSHHAETPLYSFRAHGDLDGDGDQSLFEVSAGAGPDNVLVRTPGTYIEDPLE